MLTKKEDDKLFDETINRIQYGIKPACERKKMTIEEIAVSMGSLKKDDPNYIVLSNELSSRLSNKQYKVAIIAAVVGAVIGSFCTSILNYDTNIPVPKQPQAESQAKTHPNAQNVKSSSVDSYAYPQYDKKVYNSIHSDPRARAFSGYLANIVPRSKLVASSTVGR